jgi:2'-5' RNA ligase
VWFVGAHVGFGDDPAAVPPSPAVVPTRPGDRHVTLVYLGPVPEEDADGLWRALPALALPEQTAARAWALFGRRAIAVTLTDDDGRLETAADACIALARSRLPQLRPPARFRPHVTLGRVGRRATPPSRAAVRTWPLPARPLTVGRPTLFRTAADRSGDRYEVVAQQR